MDALSEKILELNQNYNDLGEDLVLLEALVEAACRENEFPEDCIESASHRMADYIEQHAEAINQLAKSIIGKPPLPAGAPLQTPSCRAGRQAAERRARQGAPRGGARSRGSAALRLHSSSMIPRRGGRPLDIPAHSAASIPMLSIITSPEPSNTKETSTIRPKSKSPSCVNPPAGMVTVANAFL